MGYAIRWRILARVPTLVRDPLPVEIADYIERRRRLGQDLYDEVWEGVLHVNPAPSSRHGELEQQLTVMLRPLARERGLTSTGTFNLGHQGDFRVPDMGLHRDWSDQVWHPTVALAVEIVSPDDETYAKFGFYAARGVDELLIVDPARRVVEWYALGDHGYGQVGASRLIDAGPDELARRIDWPT